MEGLSCGFWRKKQGDDKKKKKDQPQPENW